MFPHRRLALVTPVLDDWESFVSLVHEIDRLYRAADFSLRIVAVDDGSTTALEAARISVSAEGCIVAVEVLHLAINVGHQRAIAIGLTKLVERDDIDAVVVMDCDGEDQPADIRTLLAAARQEPDHVVLARRVRRSESRTFRAFYALFKGFFRVLTGQAINFGNFSLIPISSVRRLVYMGELWNNLPISIMRSRSRLQSVPTARGKRYAGSSKMNLTALIVHGMSAMSVYTEIIFVRLLLGSALVACMTLLGIVAATVIRLTTSLAIPGWTTTVVGVLTVVLIQTTSLVVVTALMVLSGRRVRPMIPILDCGYLIAGVENIALARALVGVPHEEAAGLSAIDERP